MQNKYYLKPPTPALDLRRLQQRRQLTNDVTSIKQMCLDRNRSKNRSFHSMTDINDGHNQQLDKKIHFDINSLKSMINKKKSSLLQESFEIDEEFQREKEEQIFNFNMENNTSLRNRSESCLTEYVPASKIITKQNYAHINEKFEFKQTSEKVQSNQALNEYQNVMQDLFGKIKTLILEEQDYDHFSSISQSEEAIMQEISKLQKQQIVPSKQFYKQDQQTPQYLQQSSDNEKVLKMVYAMLNDFIVPFITKQQQSKDNQIKESLIIKDSLSEKNDGNQVCPTNFALLKYLMEIIQNQQTSTYSIDAFIELLLEAPTCQGALIYKVLPATKKIRDKQFIITVGSDTYNLILLKQMRLQEINLRKLIIQGFTNQNLFNDNHSQYLPIQIASRFILMKFEDTIDPIILDLYSIISKQIMRLMYKNIFSQLCITLEQIQLVKRSQYRCEFFTKLKQNRDLKPRIVQFERGIKIIHRLISRRLINNKKEGLITLHRSTLINTNQGLLDTLFFINSYRRVIMNLMKIRDSYVNKVKTKHFHQWKNGVSLNACMDMMELQNQSNSKYKISQSELLECKLQLQKIKLEQNLLTKRDYDRQEELSLLHIDNTIKSKCLSTALIHNWVVRRESQQTKLQNTFMEWRKKLQPLTSYSQVTYNAHSRRYPSNHDETHMKARLRGGCYLMESFMVKLQILQVKESFRSLALAEAPFSLIDNHKSPSPISKHKRYQTFNHFISQPNTSTSQHQNLSLDYDEQQSILWDIHQKQNPMTPNNVSNMTENSPISSHMIYNSSTMKGQFSQNADPNEGHNFYSQRIRFQEVNQQLNEQSRGKNHKEQQNSNNGQFWSNKAKDFVKKINHKRNNSTVTTSKKSTTQHTKHNSTIHSDCFENNSDFI